MYEVGGGLPLKAEEEQYENLRLRISLGRISAPAPSCPLWRRRPARRCNRVSIAAPRRRPGWAAPPRAAEEEAPTGAEHS